MRYSSMGFVPQYDSGFVNNDYIKSYVEQQERNTQTYPAPTGGSTNITLPVETSTSKPTSDGWVVYLVAAVGVLGIIYALK